MGEIIGYIIDKVMENVIAMLLIGALFLYLGCDPRAFIFFTGISAPAKVTSCVAHTSNSRHGRSTTYEISYSYDIGGKQYTGSGNSLAASKVGSTIDIQYLQSRPAVSILNYPANYLIGSLFYLIIAVFFFILAAFRASSPPKAENGSEI